MRTKSEIRQDSSLKKIGLGRTKKVRQDKKKTRNAISDANYILIIRLKVEIPTFTPLLN